MAKISLSKITPIKNISPKVININGEDIAVIQYLPISDKIAFIERLLNYSFDETGFASPVRLETYFGLELIRSYTNISITDKMFENIAKTYDILETNGIIDTVVEAISSTEYEALWELITDSLESVTKYNTSFVGMMKAVASDYSNTKINLDEMSDVLKDPNQLALLKDILTKIG